MTSSLHQKSFASSCRKILQTYFWHRLPLLVLFDSAIVVGERCNFSYSTGSFGCVIGPTDLYSLTVEENCTSFGFLTFATSGFAGTKTYFLTRKSSGIGCVASKTVSSKGDFWSPSLGSSIETTAPSRSSFGNFSSFFSTDFFLDHIVLYRIIRIYWSWFLQTDIWRIFR